MSLFPERAWWGPTNPRVGILSSQPVAHAIGGTLVTLAAVYERLPHPIFAAGCVAAFWQSWRLEPLPDGSYPFSWIVYDVLTALLAATVVTWML